MVRRQIGSIGMEGYLSICGVGLRGSLQPCKSPFEAQSEKECLCYGFAPSADCDAWSNCWMWALQSGSLKLSLAAAL